VHAGFWWGQLRDRDHSESLVVHGSIILKCIFKVQISKNNHTLTHALTPTFCATDHFEGTNDVPKHVGDLLTSDVYILVDVILVI
jgi:hypothetical protein